MKNQEIARLLEMIADALELKGETGFRPLAYRRAARVLNELTEDVEDLARDNRLESVSGIGTGIAKKIREYLTTGKIRKLEEVTRDINPELFTLLNIPGVGPKTVKLLHEKLGVNNIYDLKRVLADGSAASLPGMGEKKVTNILKSIEVAEHAGQRMYLKEAFELAEAIIKYMDNTNGLKRITFAGSLRRGKETVGDIDILAVANKPELVVKKFVNYEAVQQILSAGPTKASIRVTTEYGIRQVDLRIVQEDEFGAALQYFTGSKDHNIAIRTLAQKQGLKMSEYGVFKGEKRIAGKEEEEVYRTLKLAYIEPELREDRGEIEAAQEGRLPNLIQIRDIRSDLHIHTDASDGVSSLEEIITACKKMGYSHIAITEHSVSAGYAGGLSEEELLRQCDKIDNINARLSGFRILKGAEVDITINGNLDYSDKVLARLDVVIASIHQGFNREPTKRICHAIEHPLVHIIAHPSGRLIDKRPGYSIDLEKVIECAAKFHKVLEINSFYQRLDLNDIWAKRAKDAGVLLAINTDAHGVTDLNWMRYGVITARRAWIERKDVINCFPLHQLIRLLREMRRSS